MIKSNIQTHIKLMVIPKNLVRLCAATAVTKKRPTEQCVAEAKLT